MVGSALAEMLVAKNYRVMILSRTARQNNASVSYAQWNPDNFEIDPVAVSQADHIVHLAGANVAEKRWSKKQKAIIVNSRVTSGKTIVKALQEFPNKVQSVVSASGQGWYGPDKKGQRLFSESDPPYNDFLGSTCVQWEKSIEPVTSMGKRLVIFRTGIVLSNKGGAFPEFKKPFRGGIAAILGSGRQKISWIHIHDICRAYLAAIENNKLDGVYNAVAPEIVSNKEFILTLAKARRKPYLPVHVPSFVLQTMLGEMSVEVLKSASVDCSKLRGSGFTFVYPTLDAAFADLMREM